MRAERQFLRATYGPVLNASPLIRPTRFGRTGKFCRRVVRMVVLWPHLRARDLSRLTCTRYRVRAGGPGGTG